jgi:hypothetical protein
VPLAAAISRFTDRSSKFRVEWPRRAWWVKVFLFWLALQGLVVLVVRLARAEIGEVPAPPAPAPPAPTPPALTEGQVAGLGLAGLAIGLGITGLVEAAGGVMATVGVAETTALGVGIGQALAQGGVAGTTAAISIGTVAVASIAISILALGIIVVVLLPTLAQALRQSHPQIARSGGTGEQTDQMHQQTVQAAELENNPQGAVTVEVAISPGGDLVGIAINDDLDLNAAMDAAINAGGQSNVPPGIPTTHVELSPVTDLTTPGDPTATPDAPAPDQGSPDVGLFMVADGGSSREAAVPNLPTAWALLAAGTVAWAMRRRN